ncbi:MAG: hypothetical protein IH895_07465 [Planctomycetes bacterium]|nr:hypothetical protein [Planctomycetota bacterium]
MRGNESKCCPECGAAADLDALSQPQIPWVYRKGRSLFRSYWQTVWLVMFRPRRLHEEMSRDVSEDHARKFRSVTFLHVIVPVAVVVDGLYFVDVVIRARGFNALEILGVCGGSAAALACIWLFMWAVSSIAGDFLRDDRIAPEMQDRAVALSYYTCAPMLGMPLAGLINILAQIPGNGLILGSTFEMAAILIAGGLPLVLMGLWVHSVLALARYVLHLSLWEQIRFEATQIVLWLGTAVATLVVLPLAILYLLAVVFSFF